MNLPSVLRTHHVWAALWLVSLLFAYNKIFSNKHVFYLILYGFFIIIVLFNSLWLDIGWNNKKYFITEYYQISVALSIFFYYILEKDYVGLAKLVKWSFIFIIITGIMSIVTSIINPTYARDLIGVDMSRQKNAMKS